MASNIFEPRRVAPRALWRWTRQALALMVRAPLPFGAALVAAALVDWVLAAHLAKPWIAPISALLYWPWFAAAVIAARAADDDSRPAVGLAFTALKIGLCVAAASIFVIWLPAGNPVLLTTERSLWRLAGLWGSLGCYVTGAFLLPLIAFSQLSGRAALRLSWLGHGRNIPASLSLSGLMMATTIGAPLLLPPGLDGFVPLFHGVLFYVAYRDVFEARACNAAPVAIVRLVPAPIVVKRSSR